MTNHECAKTLRRGLDKYLENSMYVPGFADALRHAIYELERPDRPQLICTNKPQYQNTRSKKDGSNYMYNMYVQGKVNK